MHPASVALWALAAAAISTPTALRSGCASQEPIIAQLPAGQPIRILSALSSDAGSCYKIETVFDGRTVSGYVWAGAVQGSEAFERARQQARDSALAKPVHPARAMAQALAQSRRSHPALKAWELIEANQPAEALGLVEPELKRYPADPFLLAVAAMAYYRLDNLDRAILYWRAAHDIEPSPSLEALLRRAETEKGADTGSERMVGARVILRYERAALDAELARVMLDALDQEYARLVTQLGCRATEKVVAVVQSRQAYLQSTRAAEWSAGLWDGRIHIPVSQTRAVSKEMRETIAHELVHACLYELGSWPAWLHEGLAQKYSGRSLSRPERAALEELIAARKVPKLDQLGQNWSQLEGEHARIAYGLALLAAETLLELYENTGIGNLLRNPSELRRVEARIAQALGW